MPSAVSLSSVTRPTPGIIFTGKVSIKVSTAFGSITNRPSGLRQSLATLARNLFGATPAETVMPTCWFTSARMALRSEERGVGEEVSRWGWKSDYRVRREVRGRNGGDEVDIET